MKDNKTIATGLALAGFLLIAITISGGVVGYSMRGNQKLSVNVTTPKQTYILGEKIHLDFKVENRGQEITVPQSPSVRCGYLRIQVTDESKTYKDYFGSKWQKEDCEVVIPLKENEFFKAKETLLWNVKPEVSHLNVDAAKRVSKDRILTDYVFPKAGAYLIKAVLSFPDDILPKIESKPIQIIVKEPTGEDLEVWNKIKDNGDIAYFLQEGDFKNSGYKYKGREELRQQVEQILVDHPNSFYAQPFKESLEKFQAIEEKRKAFQEKMKANQSN